MADKKIYTITINGLTESIEGVNTLGVSLDKLNSKLSEQGGSVKSAKSGMDELAKAQERLKQWDEEYQLALASTKAAISEKNKAIKEEMDLEKAYITVSENVKDTYQDKQTLLTALGKVIKNTTGDTSELRQQYASLNEELKQFDSTMGNHQREVGDYRGALKEATMELKTLKGEMLGVEKGSEQWNQLAKAAGALQDKIEDANQAVKRFSSDTKKLDDVINIAKSATAAFNLYKGAMSAFGLETEEAEKAVQKLAAGMSILQSLQTLQKTLEESSATAKVFNLALKVTGAELVTNQVNAIKAAAGNTALSASQKAAAVTSKTLGLALKAIPLFLVIGLVATLITHWEDLCGWLDKTFPKLKEMGGLMNTLKATVMGLGKAILNWLVNPIKTLADVFKKIFEGDFKGALDAAKEGLKQQFQGTAEAFKTGYQAQVEKGLEQITAKAAAEQAKQTKYELDMLIARKGNQAKYSKEGIALQKKEFELRKKAAKNNEEELKKIALDEANFYRECQEQKTAAAKQGAKDRADAAKAAADAEKKAEEQRIKNIEQTVKLQDSLLQNEIKINSNAQRLAKERLKAYESGPIEKYNEALKDLNALQKEALEMQGRREELAILGELQKEYPQYFETIDIGYAMIERAMNGTSEEANKIDKQLELTAELTNGMTKDVATFYMYLVKHFGMTEEQAKRMIVLLNQYKNAALEMQDGYAEALEQSNKSLTSALKAEAERAGKVAEEVYNNLKKAVSGSTDNIVFKNKLLGIIDMDETTKNLTKLQKQWIAAWKEMNKQYEAEVNVWDAYLEKLKSIYPEDSQAYKDAVAEKEKALDDLMKKLKEVEAVANTPINVNIDYSGTGSDPKKRKSKSPNNRKKNKTKDNGETDWSSLVDPDSELWENMSNVSELLFENVLDPMADAFQMLLEFQIEEAEAALEKAEDMHDASLTKIEESHTRLADINNDMKDASASQLATLKQQQADEMLLLAQREAEEKRLAREKEKREKELQKKQKQMKKQELAMQMIEGIINTAVGVTKALTWGFPLGVIFAAIIGAMGAVETAIIAKQMSKLADGGVLGGKPHSKGGTKIPGLGVEVERGEAVINKKSTSKYLPLLDAINADGNGGKHTLLQSRGNAYKYAAGGVLNASKISNNFSETRQDKAIENAIKNVDLHPVVEVVQIAKGLKDLSTVREYAGGSKLI